MSHFEVLTYIQVELNLSHNILQELPEEFGSLTRLSKLDLSYNLLEDLPFSLCKCKNLTLAGALLVEGNPITEKELLSAIEQGSEQLLKHLEKKMKGK
jgi:Leucine-rich repeat (LRR) protein